MDTNEFMLSVDAGFQDYNSDDYLGARSITTFTNLNDSKSREWAYQEHKNFIEHLKVGLYKNIPNDVQYGHINIMTFDEYSTINTIIRTGEKDAIVQRDFDSHDDEIEKMDCRYREGIAAMTSFIDLPFPSRSINFKKRHENYNRELKKDSNFVEQLMKLGTISIENYKHDNDTNWWVTVKSMYDVIGGMDCTTIAGLFDEGFNSEMEYLIDALRNKSNKPDKDLSILEQIRQRPRYNDIKEIDLKKYQEFVKGVTSDESNSTEALIDRINGLEILDVNVNVALLLTGSIGLNSESGEFIEIVKKAIFQGKPLDDDTIFHLKRELGDIMWYWINSCRALNLDPNDVIQENVNKLKSRYPGGEFNIHHSENRKEGDL